MGKGQSPQPQDSVRPPHLSKTTSDQSNFILKAFDIVSSMENHEVIHWSKSGYSFIIEDIQKFQQIILPKYFRHNRYQSFVRQLNMYDFHKVRNGDYYCQNKSQFRHQEFYRSNYPQILNIKRKGFKQKTPAKQNTRKGFKNNGKKIKKNKKTKTLHESSKQNRKPIAPVRQQPQESSDSENVSMQIECQIEEPQNCQGASQKKFDPNQFIALVVEDMLENYLNKQIKYSELNSQKRFSFHIEMAETIKQKWNSHNPSLKNDAPFMKQIYNRVKSVLEGHKTEKDKTQEPVPFKSSPNFQNIEQLISIEEEEDIIIDSIFKKDIRSTLISINSQTFLNHEQAIKKNDLLMYI